MKNCETNSANGSILNFENSDKNLVIINMKQTLEKLIS